MLLHIKARSIHHPSLKTCIICKGLLCLQLNPIYAVMVPRWDSDGSGLLKVADEDYTIHVSRHLTFSK
jgi:hypothetical protein